MSSVLRPWTLFSVVALTALMFTVLSAVAGHTRGQGQSKGGKKEAAPLRVVDAIGQDVGLVADSNSIAVLIENNWMSVETQGRPLPQFTPRNTVTFWHATPDCSGKVYSRWSGGFLLPRAELRVDGILFGPGSPIQEVDIQSVSTVGPGVFSCTAHVVQQFAGETIQRDVSGLFPPFTVVQ